MYMLKKDAFAKVIELNYLSMVIEPVPTKDPSIKELSEVILA